MTRHLVAASNFVLLLFGLVPGQRAMHSGLILVALFSSIAAVSANEASRFVKPSPGTVYESVVLSRFDATPAAISFSNDGSLLAIGNESGELQVWKWPSRDLLLENADHSGPVRGLAFSPDNRILASSGADECIRKWQVATGDRVGIACPGNTSWIYSLSWSSERDRLASGDQSGYLKTWDMADLSLILNVEVGSMVPQVRWLISRDAIMLTTGYGELQLRDAKSGAVLWKTKAGHTFSLSPDENVFAAVDFDDALNIGEVSGDGKPTVINSKEYTEVAFAPHRSLLAVGTRDGSICLHAAPHWNLIDCWEGHAGFISALEFSRNGEALVSGSGDGSVRVWVQEVNMDKAGHQTN